MIGTEVYFHYNPDLHPSRFISQAPNDSSHPPTQHQPIVPAFYKDRPKLWFRLVRGEFEACGVQSDSRRAHFVLRALDKEEAKIVAGTLEITPVGAHFSAIERTLVNRYSPSIEKRVDTFISLASNPIVDGSNLASLMDELCLAVCGLTPKLLALSAFRRALPEGISRVLPEPSEDINITEYALEAERLMLRPSNLLSHAVTAIKASHTRQNFSKPPLFQNDFDKNGLNDAGICWYHARYDTKANKCRLGCRRSPHVVAAPTVVDRPNHPTISPQLLYLPSSDRTWLVDSGSTCSLIPTRSLGPPIFHLRAANDSVIPVYGTSRIDINLRAKSVSVLVFLADVASPILGADFLLHDLLLDMSGSCLRHPDLSIAATLISGPPALLHNV
eukprot:TCALIF_13761-PA protein Name:"Protein of unknown function" AED:0.10 eAED:0.14 QI:50/0/0/1/0/0/2/0/387